MNKFISTCFNCARNQKKKIWMFSAHNDECFKKMPSNKCLDASIIVFVTSLLQGTCWIPFALFTVESLSLLYLLFIS